MRLLVEIDRQGSLSAAAAAIGIGQSSVSEHLRLLELAAGQRLVERERPRQQAHRGGARPRGPRSPGTRSARRRRRGARRSRRAPDGNDPPRRLDRTRRLPAARHARLLPHRLSECPRPGRDRGQRRDHRPTVRRTYPARDRRGHRRRRPRRARAVRRRRDRRGRPARSPARQKWRRRHPQPSPT